MSYDLRVATAARPSDELIGDLTAGLVVEGSLADGQLAVYRRPGGPPIVVDGPVGVELDDLDDELAGAVLAPRWLLEVSVPEGASADLTLARKLARQLAERFDGGAFDPQQDKLLWPRGGRALPRPDVRRADPDGRPRLGAFAVTLASGRGV